MKTDTPTALSDAALAMLAKAGINPLGYVRVRELKPRLGVPFGVSTIWKKCAETPPQFPPPIRIYGVTCWRVADVVGWLEAQSAQSAETAGHGARLTAARQAKRSRKPSAADLAGQG